MSRTYLCLIAVWTLFCLSGLGVFLFDTYHPGLIMPGPAATSSITLSIALWIVVWLAPVTVVIVKSRREG